MDDPQKNLATNLRNRIARNNLSVQDLADQTGISRQTVYRVINGEIWPSADYLAKIANALHCNAADLFGEPVAQRLPTIHEALRVIEKAVERVHEIDKATGAKRELFEILPTLDDFEAKRLLAFANDLQASRTLKTPKTADDAKTGNIAKNPRKA